MFCPILSFIICVSLNFWPPLYQLRHTSLVTIRKISEHFKLKMARSSFLATDHNLTSLIWETPGPLSENSTISTASLNVSFICLSTLKLDDSLKTVSFSCHDFKWILFCFPFIIHRTWMLRLVPFLLPNVAYRLYSHSLMLRNLFLLDYIVIVVHIFKSINLKKFESRWSISYSADKYQTIM